MKEIKYIPKAILDPECKIDGYFVVVLPSYPQRLRYYQESQLDPEAKDGSVDKAMKALGSLAKLVDMLGPHVKEVHLQFKDGSGFIKTWEEVLHSPDCDQIIQELSGALLSGFQPSKN